MNTKILIPIECLDGPYNKVEVITRDGYEFAYSWGKVAFAYATLLAYPEGLSISECIMGLGIRMNAIKRAFQLGIIKETNDDKIQAISCSGDLNCISIESKVLKANLKEISLEAKEFYVWTLYALRSGTRRTKGDIFIGSIKDVLDFTTDACPEHNRTFEHVRIDALVKIAMLEQYGLLELRKESGLPIAPEDINDNNEGMSIAFKVGVLKNSLELSEQLLNKFKDLGDEKSIPNFSQFIS